MTDLLAITLNLDERFFGRAAMVLLAVFVVLWLIGRWLDWVFNN